ncbi:hypothetical protein [Winogradskyella sp.]|uniref:hypothetical protein n=1 Tax=Winogradskyella sp. TaxID=1883156 RepID=UPI002601D000|nr:hypothetical protein [Winogradskyella sp.]
MELPKGFHREVIEARENARKKVSTSLINHGGSNFETYSLHKLRNGSYRFSPSYKQSFELISILILPVGFITYLIIMFLSTGSFGFVLNNLMVFIFGIIITFSLTRYFLLKFKLYNFNRKKGLYYEGFPLLPSFLTHRKIKIGDILAIQILGERIYDIETGLKANSFELNLVLKSLRRVHVIDHNNLQGMLDDAQELSAYLNIPIWHAKSGK